MSPPSRSPPDPMDGKGGGKKKWRMEKRTEDLQIESLKLEIEVT